MKLLRLGRANWDVVAICDEDGGCPVLDILLTGHREGSKEARNKMLSLLTQSVPFDGPQLENRTVCKPLEPRSESLYEFRKQPKRGSKPRVVWFFDGEWRIVCAVAFFKTDRTPEDKLWQARALRRSYFRAKATGDLQTLEMPARGGRP